MTQLDVFPFLLIYTLGAVAVALAWLSNRHTPDEFSMARIFLWPIWFVGTALLAIYEASNQKDR